jgi:hypothetical protein
MRPELGERPIIYGICHLRRRHGAGWHVPARRGNPAGRDANRDCVPMPIRRHYRRPNPDRRRALELLAASRHGYGKAILRAHGFSVDMLVELVQAGLATTKRERIVAGSRQTDGVRVRITDAGRQALAKMSK